MATTQIGALSVKISADTSGVTKGIKSTTDQLDRASGKLKDNSKNFDRWSKASIAATASLSASVVLATNKVIDYADSYTSITNKLKLATDGTENLKVVTDALFESASKTGSSVEASAELYAKMERSTRDLNISQERLLSITESINKSFGISGASTQEASGAIRQLGQAMQSGALRGDEFNSIAEGAPIIMEAVSKATGKTAGELRKLAAEGLITSDVLIASLERYKDKINKDYSTAVKTYSQKQEIAKNAAIKFVGENDTLTKSVGLFGDALVTLSENLDIFANILKVVATLYGSTLVASLVKATAAKVAATQASIVLAQAEVKTTAGALALAKANQAEALTAFEVAKAEQSATFAMYQSAQGTTKTTIARTTLATSNINLAATSKALAASQLSTAAATTAAAAATATLTTTATVAGRTLSLLRGAVAALGGPVGVLIAAATSLALFVDWESDAEKQSKLLTKEVDNQILSIKGLNKANLELKAANNAAQMTANLEAIKPLNEALKDAIKNQRELKEQYRQSTPEYSSNEQKIRELTASLKPLLEVQENLQKVGSAIFEVQGPVKDIQDKSAKGDDGGNDKLVKLQEDNKKFLEELRKKIKSAEQLENDAFKKDLERLKETYKDKNNLTAEELTLEAGLISEHQKKIKEIKLQDVTKEIKDRFKTEKEILTESYGAELELLRLTYKDKNNLTFDQYKLEKQLLNEHQEALKEANQPNDFIKSLQDRFKSEKELINDKYNEDLKLLKASFASSNKTTQAQYNAEQALKKAHQEALKEIDDPIQSLQNKFNAEKELVNQKYKDDLAKLQQAFDQKGKVTSLQRALELQLEIEHQAALNAIDNPEKAIKSLSDKATKEKELLTQIYSTELELLQQSFDDKNEITAAQTELETKLKTERDKALKDAKKPDEFVQSLIDRFMTKSELEEQFFSEEMELLEERLGTKKGMEDLYRELKENLEQEHSDRMVEIAKAEADAKKRIISNGMNEMIAALANGGKKAQKLSKAIAITQAVLKGKEAAVSAWSAGMSVGGPWAPLFAAAYTAASIANTASMINGIKSSGSSGAAPSASLPNVSTPSASSLSNGSGQQQAQPQRNISINMTGSGLFSSDQVRELIGQINDQIGDGVNLNTGG